MANQTRPPHTIWPIGFIHQTGGWGYVYQLTNQIRPHAKPGTQRKLDSSSFHWPNRIINRAQTSLRKQSQEVYSKKNRPFDSPTPLLRSSVRLSLSFLSLKWDLDWRYQRCGLTCYLWRVSSPRAWSPSLLPTMATRKTLELSSESTWELLTHGEHALCTQVP